MRSNLLAVAENQPRYARGNVLGKLVFPWGEGMQLGKSGTSLLPATSGFVPGMMPCEDAKPANWVPQLGHESVGLTIRYVTMNDQQASKVGALYCCMTYQ
jgi:hypothetical protein